MAATSHLNRVLGMPSIVLFGLAYLVPLTVFTTYGVVTEQTSGHLPAAYVVTLTAMLFTAYSYGLMVRAHPFAGSAYTYTQRSFGPHLGFMTGWALLLDYLFLPMINYLVMGIYLQAAFPAVPVAVWIVAAFSLVNLSVIKHYVIDEGRRAPANLLAYAVVPGIGVLLTLWLWTSLSATTFAVGLAWIAAGFLYLLGLTRLFSRRPPELHLSEAEPVS